MNKKTSSYQHWAPDVRRRIRARWGPAEHALKTLADSLRLRGRYLAGSTVVLLGFDTSAADESAQKAERTILETLKRYGAHIRKFTSVRGSHSSYEKELSETLRDADAVLIDTDSDLFRALRPKELREYGVDLIVATTLRA